MSSDEYACVCVWKWVLDMCTSLTHWIRRRQLDGIREGGARVSTQDIYMQLHDDLHQSRARVACTPLSVCVGRSAVSITSKAISVFIQKFELTSTFHFGRQTNVCLHSCYNNTYRYSSCRSNVCLFVLDLVNLPSTQNSIFSRSSVCFQAPPMLQAFCKPLNEVAANRIRKHTQENWIDFNFHIHMRCWFSWYSHIGLHLGVSLRKKVRFRLADISSGIKFMLRRFSMAHIHFTNEFRLVPGRGLGLAFPRSNHIHTQRACGGD